MEFVQNVLSVIGALTVLIGGGFTARKGLGWLSPISVQAGMSWGFQGEQKDEIHATVTNRSREAVYIVECNGRSANTLRYIVFQHLSKPLTKPRLYPCIWFGPPTYPLMDDTAIRLEPDEPVELHHELNFDLPMFAFHNPMLQVEVKLSNGRKFRSRRLRIPEGWHVSHHITSRNK